MLQLLLDYGNSVLLCNGLSCTDEVKAASNTLHQLKPHPPSHSLGVVGRLSDVVLRKVQLASPVIWGRVL